MDAPVIGFTNAVGVATMFCDGPPCGMITLLMLMLFVDEQ